MILELDESRTPERLACDGLQKAKARVKELTERSVASDSKYSKNCRECGSGREDLRTRVMSLLPEHIAE